MKKSSGDVDGLQAEINGLRNKLNLVVDDLEVTREDNVKLSSELQQQQLLYNELKKMRGRGDEVELLQQTQRDVVSARDMAEDYHTKWQRAEQELESFKEERQRLLREAAQLRSSQGAVSSDKCEDAPHHLISEPTGSAAASGSRLMPSEAVMANIGSLKLWEILLGLLFLSVVISYVPIPF